MTLTVPWKLTNEMKCTELFHWELSWCDERQCKQGWVKWKKFGNGISPFLSLHTSYLGHLPFLSACQSQSALTLSIQLLCICMGELGVTTSTFAGHVFIDMKWFLQQSHFAKKILKKGCICKKYILRKGIQLASWIAFAVHGPGFCRWLALSLCHWRSYLTNSLNLTKNCNGNKNVSICCPVLLNNIP